MAKKKVTNPHVVMQVPGTYEMHEFVTLAQHVAEQLQARGVEGFECQLKFRCFDGGGEMMEFRQFGEVVQVLELDINPDDFARPALPSAWVDGVPANQSDRPGNFFKPHKKHDAPRQRPKGMR